MNLGTRRLRGRLRNRWQDKVRENGKTVGGEGWQEKVHNREEWKKLLRTAWNHHILYMPTEGMNEPPSIHCYNLWWTQSGVMFGLTTDTGCPRRNVPDFRRVFLMLKYTDITQNTYIQSWTVTEIMAREKCGLLAVPCTAPFQLTRYEYTARVLETGMQSPSCLPAHVKCLEP